jgi:hypothetical protein
MRGTSTCSVPKLPAGSRDPSREIRRLRRQPLPRFEMCGFSHRLRRLQRRGLQPLRELVCIASQSEFFNNIAIRCYKAALESLSMILLATPSATTSPGEIAAIIVGVLASCAFLGWMMWRACQSAERGERDPRYRRRVLLRGALLYTFCAAYGVEQVISGNAPVQSLLGLIVLAFLIWSFIKQANRVKLPPS